MISALTNKVTSAPRDGEAAIRMICRAVIRRVRDENPGTAGYELFLRIWAANPFEANDDLVQQLFHDEAVQSVQESAFDAPEHLIESESFAYTASPFLQ